MSILPIEPLGSGTGVLPGAGALQGIGGVGDPFAAAGEPRRTEGAAAAFAGHLDRLQATHAEVDRLAVDAATGRLEDVHDYTIAATRSQLATELTVTLRNKAVEAFTEILRMPV